MNQPNRPFREKYRALVWSNPAAAPEVFIRQALLRPDFSTLLDAASEFGLPIVHQQWALLEREADPQSLRATPTTRRMLAHLASAAALPCSPSPSVKPMTALHDPRLDASRLQPGTAQVWQFMQDHPLLSGFILIGAAALTMRLNHTREKSINLVFAEPGQRLPRVQIQAWQDDLQARGIAMELTQDPEAHQTYRESGMDLADYRQKFMTAYGVKVTLSCSDPPLNRLLSGKRTDPVRVANLDELFAAAAYACAERSRPSDCLDLYVLLTAHGYTLRMVYEVFERAEHTHAFNIAQMRLRRCTAVLDGEGYAGLPSAQEMRLFFNRELDMLECTRARERLSVVGTDAPRGVP